MPKTVLVTGANGFLGRHVTELIKSKKFNVITTDISTGADIVGNLCEEEFVAKLPVPDVIVNCAAVQYVNKNLPLINRKDFFLKNNVLTAQNLCKKFLSNDIHFIHIGTSMLYQQTGQEIYSVKDNITGEGIYSFSKALAQKEVEKLPKTATVIPCIIAGKGREGLFVPLVASISNLKCGIFPGKGKNPIHLVHVEDVASLICTILETQATGLFNAAGLEPLSINQWVDKVATLLNLQRIRKISIPLSPLSLISKMMGYRLLAREQLLMLQHPHVLDITESLQLGWIPKFNNEKIIELTAQHIINKAK
jgi:nucleoside-diphosphate-sugar epimerase